MFGNEEVVKFLKAAAEATVFVAPCDFGLDKHEVFEAARRANFHDGEIGDAIRSAYSVECPGKRDFMVDTTPFMLYFNGDFPTDYLNIEAVEHVFHHLRDAAKRFGANQARFLREALCASGEQASFSLHDMNVAITCLLLAGVLKESEQLIGFRNTNIQFPSPKEQIRQGMRHKERKHLDRAIPIVKDIISRRSDGRTAAADPYDAFTNTLASLDFGHFKAWWVQALAELKPLSHVNQPTSQIVLAAALAEAALCFVVPRAHKVGMMRDLNPENPRSWKFEGLIKGAAQNGGTPGLEILGASEQSRARLLNTLRQRIHAGALIEQFRGKPIPDIRPEEATEAVATSKMIVRRVLDWLERYPKGSA